MKESKNAMAGSTVRGLLLVQAMFGQILGFENDLITEQLISYGAHTRCELAFLSHFVDPGDTILDIGAHIGTFTIPLAQKVGPNGLVIAVEADQRNHAVLVANTKLTQTSDRVQAANLLVGSPAETYELAQDESNTGMSHPIPVTDRTRGIRGLTLDEISAGKRQVAIVKIVVQGMELEALCGAEQLLLSSRPILYVQVHRETLSQYNASPEQIDLFLRARGYRFFVNVGDRNAAHDRFVIAEVDKLGELGAHFDLLAIPQNHARLSRTGFS
jgi:FkbM family methyltransferase